MELSGRVFAEHIAAEVAAEGARIGDGTELPKPADSSVGEEKKTWPPLDPSGSSDGPREQPKETSS